MTFTWPPVAFENDLGFSLSSSIAGDLTLVVVVVVVVIVFNLFSRRISAADVVVVLGRRVADGPVAVDPVPALRDSRSCVEPAAAAADALVVRDGGGWPSRSRVSLLRESVRSVFSVRS